MNNIFLSTINKMSDWAARKSMWPLSFGLSCCAIEMMQAAASRFDLDRYGRLFRGSPKHADLMIVAGTVTTKMLPQLLNLYDQMLAPKFVIAMGSCAISGGLYAESDDVITNLDQFIKIDKKVAGCPPAPEDLVRAILELQNDYKG